MKDLVRQTGCDQGVLAPDMFTAMERALETVRAAMSPEDLANIRVLRTRATPYVEYGSRKRIENCWRVWIDAEMKA